MRQTQDWIRRDDNGGAQFLPAQIGERKGDEHNIEAFANASLLDVLRRAGYFGVKHGNKGSNG